MSAGQTFPFATILMLQGKRALHHPSAFCSLKYFPFGQGGEDEPCCHCRMSPMHLFLQPVFAFGGWAQIDPAESAMAIIW